MLILWRVLVGIGLLVACSPLRAQEEPPPEPGPTNVVEFLFSVAPTNNAILITETTNIISVTVSNWLSITNIVISGREGTNVVEFNDTGARPDDKGSDGIFRGNLVTPLVSERTTITLQLTLIGTDIASVTNEPPADPPVMLTNRTEITYIVVPRPPNDRFTNAFKLLSSGGIGLGTNEFASLERGEPVHARVNSADRSVWWTWAAPADGSALVDLAGSTFSAVLAVYRGDRLTNLVPVASSTNDTANRLPPNVVFPTTRGTTYRIAVSGIDSNSVGTVRLRVAPGGTPDTRPPMVSIQSPATDTLVSDPILAVSGSARESYPLDSGISNVVLQVNGGPRTNAAGAESWAAVLTLPPGTNVIRAFAIDYAGNTSVADTIVVRYLNPTNDYFSMSAQLPGTSGFVTARNELASKEPGEPLHAGNDGGRSVWYWWRAPSEGQLLLSTSGSALETLLAVYLGNALTNLTEVVSNDDALPGSGWSEVSFVVVSNEVYRIAVDAYGAAIGDFGLQYVFTPVQPTLFYNLTVNQSRGGTVSPPGGAYPAGARVTLTAVPDGDFAFADWSGDVSSTANPLELIMSRSLRVTPRFRTARFTDDFESGSLSRIPWAAEAPSWVVQTNVVSSGIFAARTARIGGRQSTSLVLSTNTGTGTASFDVRVSTEPAWDVFEFLIDGAVVKRWSGEVEWQPYTFNLGGGRHTFTWRYTKDPNFDGGLDAAFIDNLYLPPPASSGGGRAPTLAITLFSEGAQITLQGEPNVVYEVQVATSITGPWSVLATQSAASGVINVLDLQAVGETRRFYRARAR